MRTIILTGVILSLLAQDSGSDLDKLQGTWKVIDVEAQGQKAPADVVAKTPITLTITGNKYVEKLAGKVVEEGTVKLTPDKSPRQLDIVIGSGNDKGKTQLAIYKVEADTLTVAIGPAGDKMRPADFTTKAGSEISVQVFRREKK
jgi:uncharacterized protein (TIGR03067 family)